MAEAMDLTIRADLDTHVLAGVVYSGPGGRMIVRNRISIRVSAGSATKTDLKRGF